METCLRTLVANDLSSKEVESLRNHPTSCGSKVDDSAGDQRRKANALEDQQGQGAPPRARKDFKDVRNAERDEPGRRELSQPLVERGLTVLRPNDHSQKNPPGGFDAVEDGECIHREFRIPASGFCRSFE